MYTYPAVNDTLAYASIAGCYVVIAFQHVPWCRLKFSWKVQVSIYLFVATIYATAALLHETSAARAGVAAPPQPSQIELASRDS